MSCFKGLVFHFQESAFPVMWRLYESGGLSARVQSIVCSLVFAAFGTHSSERERMTDGLFSLTPQGHQCFS